MVNIRTKGASAERDIADHMNGVIYGVYKELGLSYPTKPIVQRNQNQTAVGGKDLVGTHGLAIEVKRQEQLSINSWWRQCVASARTLNEIPVLLFKQSRLPWRCITNGQVLFPEALGRIAVPARVEISFDDFTIWYRAIVKRDTERRIAAGAGQSNGLFDGP